MKAERLEQIRTEWALWEAGSWPSSSIIVDFEDYVPELLDYVTELTRQLDDARDKAINAGIFTSSDGDESKYTHALNDEECETCGHSIYGPDDLFAGCCYQCHLEISTPGATSYKP